MSFPDDDGRTEPLATQMGHAFERGPRDRVSLGGDCHPLVISGGRRIVHEHMTSVAAEGKNPVGLPSGDHVISRNEDNDHVPPIECLHENRFADWSQVGGDSKVLRLTLERKLRHLHDAALVGGLRGLDD